MRIIDHVDVVLPFREKVVEPGSVLIHQTRNNSGFCIEILRGIVVLVGIVVALVDRSVEEGTLATCKPSARARDAVSGTNLWRAEEQRRADYQENEEDDDESSRQKTRKMVRSD